MCTRKEKKRKEKPFDVNASQVGPIENELILIGGQKHPRFVSLQCFPGMRFKRALCGSCLDGIHALDNRLCNNDV